MFSSRTLAMWTGGALPRSHDFEVDGFVTDTRTRRGARDMFVALTGPNFDGHDFLEDVTGPLLVAEGRPIPPGAQEVLVVPDTLLAIQEIAAHHRRSFSGIEVLGITGSNGKTIVKDMLSSILSRTRTTHRSPGSFNSQLGVALSLLGLRKEHTLAMIEAGISQPGEMARHAHMLAPTCGVLTNIGEAHLAGLGSLEVTAWEKASLFQGAAWVVVPWNAPHVEEAMSGNLARQIPFLVAEDAFESHPGVVAYGLQEDADGWSFSIKFRTGERAAFRLRVPGRHNVANATAAAAAAHELGTSISEIRQGLAAFELKPMRLEVHTTPGGVTLLNDTYSSDPTSARAALDALSHHAGPGRAIAILGDMLDLGRRAPIEHESLGRHMAATRGGADILVTLGERARMIGAAAVEAGMPAESVFHSEDLDALHGLLATMLRHGDTVLLKASGAMGLDRAATRLLESMGPTRLEIDLDAVRENFHALRAALGPGVGVMPVVKSFAYGNDATRVSLTLVREGANALAVAYADEGVALRRHGLELDILVTNASAWEADKLVAHRLTALVYSKEVVEALATQARLLGLPVDVHLEIDTGMNRAGLLPEEVEDFARWVRGMDEVRVRGVMTHFAAADDAAEDGFTRLQRERFDEAVAQIRAAGLAPEVLHAANTAAAWRMQDARYDMVRVGIGLYGIAPSADVLAPGTRLALRFTTRVLHVKTLQTGESIGYGRTWVAQRPTRVATIAAGYNDGFPRFLSNRGEVLIHGTRCPVIGNVCMDVAMVDVSGLTDVSVGDDVVIFGSQGEDTIAVEELAALGSTISYEILCNISERVRRVFLRA